MSNQLQITGGAKVRNLDGVITGSTGVLSSLPINGSNGIPQLDSSGKILVSQLPNSVMEYQGTWNVATNTPYLVNGVGNAGDVYLVTGAATGGTNHNFGAGNILFYNGDQTIYDGSAWQRASGSTGTVTSVAVTESSAALNITGSPITTSGTINIGFAGTSAQYVAGDGSLITFPTLTGYVPYTGATSDVDLGTHKLSLNSEQFASISAPSYSEGALWYDSTQKALAYYNDISGNVLHIGQEVQLKVHNNTGSTIAKGAPVYVTSTSSGGSSPNVALAKADTFTTSNVIGLANQAIPTGTDGYITLSGLLTGVSTGAFAVGDILYLSPYSAGQLMNTLPPTGYAIKVGVVSYSNSPNGTIYINQSNAYSTAGSIVGTIAISQGGTGATTAVGALSNLGAAASSRLISTTTPLQGGGDLTADRTLSILQSGASQSGYLSSTDWNTFNNKQNALGFVPIGGSGSINYISKFTGSTTISQSGIYEGVTNYISIGNTNTTYNLDVTGTARFTNNVLASSFSTNSASGITIGIDGSSNGGALKFTQGTSALVGGPSESSISIVSNSKFYFNFGISSGQYKGFYLDNGLLTNNTIRTYQLPDASGTLALTSQLSGVIYGSGVSYQVAWFNATNSIGGSSNLYFDPTNNRLGINQSSPLYSLDVTGASRITGQLILGSTITNGTYTYTLPSATGTLALTSQIPSLSGYVTGTAASGQVSYFNGTSSIAGSNNYYWDSTNNRLGIGLTNPQRSLEIYSATADSHLRLSGAAPSVSMGEAITGAIYQAKFGLATASGQYVSGAVAGDFVIISQTGATIWANSGGERMRLNTNGTFSIGNTNSTYNLDVTGTGRFSKVNGDSRLIVYQSGTAPYTATLELSSQTLGTYGGVVQFDGGAEVLTIQNYGRSASSSLQGGIAFNTKLGNTTPTNIFTLNGYTGAATFSSSVTAFTQGLNSDFNAGAFIARASSSSTKYVQIGFDETNTYGWIQSLQQGVAYRNLILNGAGGNVGIGTSSPDRVLTVNGQFGINNDIVSTKGGTNFRIGYEAYTSTGGVNMFTESAIPLVLGTSSTERMRITSAGNVGIGTSSPSSLLEVANASNPSIFITNTGAATLRLQAATGVVYVGSKTSDALDFITGDAPRMRITSGGNVGIGTTTISTNSLIRQLVIGQNITNGVSKLSLLSDSTSQSAEIALSSYTGENLMSIATISSSPMLFSTANTERMRITSGGNLLVGTTTDVGASFKLQVAGDGYFTKVTPSIRLNGTPFGNSGANIQLLGWASGNYNWQISTAMFSSGLELSASSTTGGSTFSTAIGLFSPSTGVYTPLSDSAKKKDFEASTIGLKEVLQLKPTLYRMKSEDANTPKTLGFIAQEVKEFIPQAYVESGEGDTKFIGLSDRPIIAALVKAVQELQQQIEELKAKIK